MNSKLRALVASTLAAALLLPSGAAWARAVERPLVAAVTLVEPHAGHLRYAGTTLDQAIAAAERHYRAKVVRASVSEFNGRRVYVLRLLSEQGRVWTVRVDAENGAMM